VEYPRFRKIWGAYKNENYSAQDVHDIFFDKAVLRIKENGINNFKLLIDKATNMWSEDTDAIKYIKGAIKSSK
jgi:hypothetical protein